MRSTRRKIAEVIAKRISSGESLSRLAQEIAAYLLSEGRLRELDSIMRDVKVIRAEAGNVEATLSLAHKLQVGNKSDLRRLVKSIKPQAKKIVINQKLDQSLIGGLKLNVIDKSLDLSIRSKLNRLNQLTNEGGL